VSGRTPPSELSGRNGAQVFVPLRPESVLSTVEFAVVQSRYAAKGGSVLPSFFPFLFFTV